MWREQVIEGQRKDAETKGIINIINKGEKPTKIELKYQPEYTQYLMNHQDSLAIREGNLIYKYYDNLGILKELLIIPTHVVDTILREIHEYMSHAELWRIQPKIMEKFFYRWFKTEN